ncbi:unnamed protein product [Urochloa humidicola]
MAATSSAAARPPCHYAVLGVARGASAADIGIAYHNLVQEWQLEGDSWTTEESRATFHRMKEAYRVLSDASRRASYDAAAFPPAPQPDFKQLSNYLFPSVNRLLTEMEGLRSRVTKFNDRMNNDPTLTMDQMLTMLKDINMSLPEDPPQVAPPKRRGRPPKNSGPSRPAGGAAGARKKKQPAAARKPRGKKGAGTDKSPSPNNPHGSKRPPPPGFDGPCACVAKSLRIRAQNC